MSRHEIIITPLPRRSSAVRRFLTLSYVIYREDPNWVAPMLADLKKVFTDANPLFEHAEMQLWMATRDGRDVGRIAGILDTQHNRVAKDNAAFFGFYECVDDRAVSRALFAAVSDWARTKGVKRLLGPMNPTTNDECGLLVEGLGERPVLMMTYNPAYYPALIEAEGYTKARDLLAFHVDIAKAPLDRLDRLAARTRQRHPELEFRPVRRRTLAADLAQLKAVYNAAWEHNWGFVAMTDAEMDFMAARMKPLLVEGLIWLVEAQGEAVGFMLAIPDYNEVFQPLRGRLLTPRLLGAMPFLLQRRFPKRCRVLTLGTKAAWRGRGLEAVMLSEGFKTGRRLGFVDAEASWVLEDNIMMCRFMEMFGARVYRRYRIYERAI
jgi:GNAT superfamily N-acetyltransferase